MKKEWLLREKYAGKETLAYKKDLKRLEKGEHIDYVIGFANFLDCKIDLSARPLIPRPETEYWVEKILQDIQARPLEVLDMFAGSGCVGISILKHRRRTKVDFADIEKKYFPGIKKSAKWNNISSTRLSCIHSDIFGSITKRYDYILANPPYIPTLGRRVQKSVLRQEPHTALFGGKDGLAFTQRLIKGAKTHLKPEGVLVIEFDPPQKAKIAALARQFLYDIRFFKDQYGRWRYASLKIQLHARSRSLA